MVDIEDSIGDMRKKRPVICLQAAFAMDGLFSAATGTGCKQYGRRGIHGLNTHGFAFTTRVATNAAIFIGAACG